MREWSEQELERVAEPNADTFKRAEELARSRPLAFDMWAATETPEEQTGDNDETG